MNELVELVKETLLFERHFLWERKVFLWGMVEDDSARAIVNRLLYLDSKEPGKEITLFINSPGGVVTSGMAIHDTMQTIASPVATVCVGMAASMGATLLSAGKKGRRFIYPYAEVMIHQPSVGQLQGRTADLEIQARHIARSKMISAQILAENCGHPVEKILHDFDRDYWMNAEESIAYGIVDQLLSPTEIRLGNRR